MAKPEDSWRVRPLVPNTGPIRFWSECSQCQAKSDVKDRACDAHNELAERCSCDKGES